MNETNNIGIKARHGEAASKTFFLIFAIAPIAASITFYALILGQAIRALIFHNSVVDYSLFDPFTIFSLLIIGIVGGLLPAAVCGAAASSYVYYKGRAPFWLCVLLLGVVIALFCLRVLDHPPAPHEDILSFVSVMSATAIAAGLSAWFAVNKWVISK